MFTKRHEQQLSEIKALTYEHGERAREVMEKLGRIKQAQNRLAGQDQQQATTVADPTGQRTALHRQAQADPAPRPGLSVARPNRSRSSSPTLARSRDSRETVVSRVRTALVPVMRFMSLTGFRQRHGARRLIAFVHIPKTAGGTVSSMLTAAYSKPEVHKAGNYLTRPERTPSKVESLHRKGGRVSIGHVPYGVLREHLPKDTRYMTFLREPVDRVLSHYYRHIHTRDERRAGRGESWSPEQGGKPKANSIEQALVEMRLPQLSDLSTRFLCGHQSPMGELTASALDDAKENLRNFLFVGIQERFEESIVLLQRTLGLGFIPYIDRHVSSDRPAVDEIPDEEQALIAEYNQLDAELYRFGLRLFEDAVAAADQGFAAEVEALRARSAAVREEEWREAALAPPD